MRERELVLLDGFFPTSTCSLFRKITRGEMRFTLRARDATTNAGTSSCRGLLVMAPVQQLSSGTGKSRVLIREPHGSSEESPKIRGGGGCALGCISTAGCGTVTC